jgi:hypothetical protein
MFTEEEVEEVSSMEIEDERHFSGKVLKKTLFSDGYIMI